MTHSSTPRKKPTRRHDQGGAATAAPIIAVIVDAVPGAVPVLIIGQRQQFVREQEIQFPAILLRAFPDRVEFSAVHAHGPRGLRARLPLIQRKRSSVFHHKKSSLSLF